MFKSVHRWIALLLLLALPLQGLAAALMPFHCPADEHGGEVIAGAHQHESITTHSHHETPSTIAEHDGAPADTGVVHLCCNHVYTGAPSVAVVTAPDAPFVLISQVATVLPPFFPERLLRPPRT